MANKKRLIDANELDGKLEKLAQKYAAQGRFEVAKDYSFVQTVLLSAPTVDAVEVSDYDSIVYKLECLLCHATGNKFSKASYSLADMERMVTDHIEECCEEAVAEEVVHGRWEDVKETSLYVPDMKYTVTHTAETCSACKVRIGFIGSKPYLYDNICPNCGAKMDGGAADG